MFSTGKAKDSTRRHFPRTVTSPNVCKNIWAATWPTNWELQRSVSFLDTAKTFDSLEHKLYKVGSLIFAYGREQRALVLNPFDDIDRPEVAYTVPEILEPAKFKQLLATAEEEVPELIPFLAMAGFAGLRKCLANEKGAVWRDLDQLPVLPPASRFLLLSTTCSP